jgi:4-amino-4-deoxy-L-arabinose transferase-like glycosyltransferase
MLDSETVETVFSVQDNPPKSNPAARIGWAVLILVTLYVGYFSHLGAIGLVGPDEPRYAWIARDMAETGDWVTPRLYGKPWFEKPPLFYWGAALSFKLFSVSEAAARLPSAISALLATLALSWLALRLYGAETARWLLLLLPTTVGMIGFSHAAATDMPFSAMLTIAMVCAAVVLGLTRDENSPVVPQTPWLTLFLFGFFLGLAVLAKGPAAIILCGGAVFFWALFTKRWRDAFSLLHPAAIAAFCVTAMPWYILCARRNPDFFRIFIFEHNFKRFLTPEFQHLQPFWFYIPVLLVAFLPWTGALLWTLIADGGQFSRSKRLSPHSFFLLSWSLFVISFFTVSQSKLPGYILPAVPAIALMLARGYGCAATARRKTFGMTLAVFALICFGVSEFADRPNLHLNSESQRLQMAAAFLLMLMVLANLVLSVGFFCFKTPWLRNLWASLCVVPILFWPLIASKLEPGLPLLSSRELAAQLLAQHVPPDRTYVYRGMGRGLRYGLNYYLRREIPDWDQKPESDVYVVSGSVSCEQLRRQGFACADVPLGSSSSGWCVSHLAPNQLAGGLAGGGELQQKK